MTVNPPDLRKLESYSPSTFNTSFTHGLKSHQEMPGHIPSLGLGKEEGGAMFLVEASFFLNTSKLERLYLLSVFYT